MASVHTPSSAELEARRTEILRDLQLTRDELRQKVDNGGLVGDEWSAWAEVREIDYLLGDD